MWRLKLCVAMVLIVTGFADLIAQSYRLEDFARAATIYRELASNQAVIENEENDLRINSRATDAQLEWQREGSLAQERKPRREDLEAFETAYNAACGSIARGELGQAEVLLKRAKGTLRSPRSIIFLIDGIKICATPLMSYRSRRRLQNFFQLLFSSFMF